MVLLVRLYEFKSLYSSSSSNKKLRPSFTLQIDGMFEAKDIYLWHNYKKILFFFDASEPVNTSLNTFDPGDHFRNGRSLVSIRHGTLERFHINPAPDGSNNMNETLSTTHQDEIANKQLETREFHLIMPRYGKNSATILEFQRPPKLYPVMFTYRHRRTIESIFYHHPNTTITLHSNYLIQDDVKRFTDAGYSIRVVPLRFEQLAAGTPLEGVTNGSRWRAWEAGPHWYTSFSNLYRLLLLWKEGGVYLDTDMIVTRPFDGLDNAMGLQDPDGRFANNAALVFKRPGSPFVRRALADIAANYSTDLWGQNGPALVTRVWRQWAPGPGRDAAVRVLGHRAFFLFHHADVRAHCFAGNLSAAARRAYAEALAARAPYAVHLANKLSGGPRGARLGEGTLCHYLLTRYCLFCDDPPHRPRGGYPPVMADGARVELP